MGIEVREPRNAEELELYYDLRWRVLRERWTTVRDSGLDEHEDDAYHLTAWDGSKLVGTGRLHFNSPEEAQVRCMAVEEARQSSGIGSLILQSLEQRACANGAKRIVLNARESALNFYRKHSYRQMDQVGTLFDSIPHWLMRKDL